MFGRSVVVLLTAFGVAVLLSTSNASAAPAPLMAGQNVLAAGNYNDNVTSSDLSLILQLSADGVALVDEGAAVKYIVPTAEIANWWKADFDDRSWLDGISGVGYADNDDNTTIPSGAASCYTRYRFNVANPGAVKSLVLLADFDDGYVVWLNGVEIARSPQMANAGEFPAWDYGAPGGKVAPNHEASDLAAGKPNAARWSHAAVAKHEVAFTPQSPTAVDPKGKLAETWATLKATR
jgi:hypothetical protein